MLAWLNSLTEQEIVTYATPIGVALAGLAAIWRGYNRGTPTSAAALAAVAAANCRALDTVPHITANTKALSDIAKEVAEMRKDLDDTHTLLIRIEDRTRNRDQGRPE